MNWIIGYILIGVVWGSIKWWDYNHYQWLVDDDICVTNWRWYFFIH